ncbi:MAG: helix-turn-helix domain-containing protein [Lachnospiraceae bacterium]|nr:helix-turn-helix domain-containing protein [Lachnospiraceae bacterium]
MFWERFYHLCEINNKKPTPVGRELGISSGIITTWKKEGHCPSGEMLIKIANYFGCSIDYLVGRSDCIEIQKSEVSDIELQFLEKLRTLPEDSQEEILYILNYKYNKLQNRKKETSSPLYLSEGTDLLA